MQFEDATLSNAISVAQVDALAAKLEEDDRELKRCLSEIETLKVWNFFR